MIKPAVRPAESCLYLFMCVYLLKIQAYCPGHTPQLYNSELIIVFVSVREEGGGALHLPNGTNPIPPSLLASVLTTAILKLSVT